MRLESKINAPDKEKVKEAFEEKCADTAVTYRFKKDVIIGHCIEVKRKNGDLYGIFEINDEYEKLFDNDNVGFSVSYMELKDENGKTLRVEPRQITVLPKDQIRGGENNG